MSLGGGGRSYVLHALLVVAVLAAAGQPAAAASSPASIVAQASGHVVEVYRSRLSKRPFLRLVSPSSYGTPLVFLVKTRVGDWDQVRLPVRPDGATGWIHDSAVTLAVDPYRVRVSLGAHRLTVWKGARVIASEPAGVGRAVLPTPEGTYFLVDLLEQPNPSGAYGPYAFGLSAFSNVLFSFGGGPGQIGLHGTDDSAALGTDVSHGCIRISNAGITKLALLLPLGTPVQIVQ
jgi:lipoprotein-anchoring transpeptidase ErfK/SrfK